MKIRVVSTILTNNILFLHLIPIQSLIQQQTPILTRKSTLYAAEDERHTEPKRFISARRAQVERLAAEALKKAQEKKKAKNAGSLIIASIQAKKAEEQRFAAAKAALELAKKASNRKEDDRIAAFKLAIQSARDIEDKLEMERLDEEQRAQIFKDLNEVCYFQVLLLLT